MWRGALSTASSISSGYLSAADEKKLQDLWLQYRASARKFALEAFDPPLLLPNDLRAGDHLEPWQVETLDDISLNDRVSIRAGHGVGKTMLLAVIVFWFMLTRYPYKIPITANSQDQLRDIVWPELRKWRARLVPQLRKLIQMNMQKLWIGEIDNEDELAPFAVARTASDDNPEALQGFHEDNLLFVIEEASGIPDIVFEVAIGALSTKGAKIIMFSNPTRISGYFFDSHHSLRHRWKTHRVNCEDVPRAQGHIRDIIDKYGKDSNQYRVRVLGE